MTAGCVRLPNEEIEALFEEIPIGTKVLITNQNLDFTELAKQAGAM